MTTVDRTPKPCHHKIADHQHGTYAAYTLDGCRCEPCARAKRHAEKARQLARLSGKPGLVDAAPVRAHIEALQAAGMGWKRIAHAAGVSESVVDATLYGRPARRGGAPQEKVRPETARAILAVPMPTLDDLGDRLPVDPTGTARRVQALACLGWSTARIAARSGVNRQAIDRALRGTGVCVATARGIQAVYEQLWDQLAPEGDQRQRIAAARARNRAARNGWVPPMAWEGIDIDNPAATPDLGRRERGADLDDWLWLVRNGEHPERAARRLGVTLGAIEKAAIRHDRDDVLDRVYTTGRRAAA